MKAPIPKNEKERIIALQEYKILDTPAEETFDEIVSLAKLIAEVPIALISLIDVNRQWFKAKTGLSASETPRDISFCGHAILQEDIFIIPDAQADPRFATNPLVTGEPYIRFYAGVPLITPEGYAIGTLCVIDKVPKNLNPEQVSALKNLAHQTVTQLQLRRHLRTLANKASAQQEKQKQHDRFLKKIAGGFGLASAIAIAIGITSYWSNSQVMESDRLSTIEQKERWDKSNQSAQIAKSISIAGTGITLLVIVALYYSINREISARKQTEASLEKERDFTHAVLDTAKALVVVLNRQGQIVRFNHACEQISGYSFDEVKNKYFWEQFFPVEEAEAVKIILEQPHPKDYPYKSETHWLSKDGKRYSIAWSNTALLDSQGQIEYIINTGIDITDRQQAEQSLQKQRAWLEATLSSIGDAVIATDSQGKITFINQVAETLTGWTASEAIGRHSDEDFRIINLETQQRIESPIKRTLEAGIVLGLKAETNLVRRDGGIVPIEGSCAPIFNWNRSLQGAVLVFRDETLRQRAQAEIKQALQKEKELNSLKSGFISMVSHEFRTPLTTILSSSEIVETLSHRLTEEKKQRHFGRIKQSIKRMTDLIEDVLLASQVESGKMEFKPTPMNLVCFCRDLVEEIQTSAANHAIAFLHQGDCTDACMDEKILQHVFTNLLSNAVKYSPAGGTVRCELYCQNGNAVFQVQDEGIGIPPEDLEKLFSTFHRADNVGNIPGTGLGLSIVKTCVELHRGKIDVTSEVGVGTTFTVILPLNALNNGVAHNE